MADTGAALVAERRLPRKSLLIALSGAAGSIAIAAYGLRYGMDALPAAWLAFGALLWLMLLGQLPTLFSYAFGPRQLVFGEHALVCDSVAHPYTGMTTVACDVGAEVTRIALADGSRLLLRWDIWVNHKDWNAIVLEQTFAHLHAQSKAALERGEKLTFGKKVALDQHALHLPGGSLPFAEIAEIRFSDEHDNGVNIRTLHVASIDRQLTVDTRHLCNWHVLSALLREALP